MEIALSSLVCEGGGRESKLISHTIVAFEQVDLIQRLDRIHKRYNLSKITFSFFIFFSDFLFCIIMFVIWMLDKLLHIKVMRFSIFYHKFKQKTNLMILANGLNLMDLKKIISMHARMTEIIYLWHVKKILLPKF